ncbi:hypothetical protein PMAYCL1PPCAC_28621, partial [Pristionchus mayeri]
SGMTNYMLKFAHNESLHTYFNVYFAEDGTIFYHQVKGKSRIFIKWDGEEVDAVLPSEFFSSEEREDRDKIECYAAYGTALFFTVKEKVFKAVCPSPGEITVHYVRDIEKDEVKMGSRLFSQIRDYKDYVYRLCDDPIRDGILLDTYSERSFAEGTIKVLQAVHDKYNGELTDTDLVCIHRQREGIFCHWGPWGTHSYSSEVGEEDHKNSVPREVLDSSECARFFSVYLLH